MNSLYSIAIAITAVITLTSCTSPRGDWPGVSYSEVRGYVYNLKGEHAAPILKDNHLHASVLNSNGVLLSSRQVGGLLKVLARLPSEAKLGNCYMPRHAFVFYGERQKPVASVEICFECYRCNTSPELSHWAVDLPALKEFTRNVGIPVFDNSDDYTTLMHQR